MRQREPADDADGGVSLSVRTRFEVFKRDRFTCSYCGRTPPEVLLEADHIIPKAAGGSDDLANLTTACATCNRGKAARLLEEGTAPVVGRATVEELAERVEQAKAYMELLGGLSTLVTRQIGMVVDAWAHAFGARVEERDTGTVWVLDVDWGEPWPNEPSVRRFLRSLPLADVLEAVDIAAAKFNGMAGTSATRYFYGVCHRAIREGRSVSAQPQAQAEPDFGEEIAHAYELGAKQENGRLRAVFLNREEHGFESLADIVSALWPED